MISQFTDTACDFSGYQLKKVWRSWWGVLRGRELCILVKLDWKKWQGRAQLNENQAASIKDKVAQVLCCVLPLPRTLLLGGKSPFLPRENIFKIMHARICMCVPDVHGFTLLTNQNSNHILEFVPKVHVSFMLKGLSGGRLGQPLDLYSWTHFHFK